MFKWVDDGQTYGKLSGGGKIGFRQMAPLVAEYAKKLAAVTRRAEGTPPRAYAAAVATRGLCALRTLSGDLPAPAMLSARSKPSTVKPAFLWSPFSFSGFTEPGAPPRTVSMEKAAVPAAATSRTSANR